MSSRRPSLAALGRAAALAGAAAALLATSLPHCLQGESASYAAQTSCGPAGELALSFSAEEPRGCGGCWSFLEAPRANAVGLPEQGEMPTGFEGGFTGGRFALVGPVALPGTDPPVVIYRECRFAPLDEVTVEVACTGEAPEAACEGTMTRLPDPGGAP